jgi:hypothetical protein
MYCKSEAHGLRSGQLSKPCVLWPWRYTIFGAPPGFHHHWVNCLLSIMVTCDYRYVRVRVARTRFLSSTLVFYSFVRSFMWDKVPSLMLKFSKSDLKYTKCSVGTRKFSRWDRDELDTSSRRDESLSRRRNPSRNSPPRYRLSIKNSQFSGTIFSIQRFVISIDR